MGLLSPTAPPAFARDLAAHGARTAVITDVGRLSYAELATRVDALARRLGPVRRLVVLEARNDLPSLTAYLAALAGGHPLVLVPPDRPAAVDDILAAYDPDVVLSSAGAEVAVREVRPGTRHVLHEDLALLLSTSGSTGSPKLVRLSAENLGSNAHAIADSLAIGPDDRAATTLPLHYCYGLSVVNSHLLRGAAVVLTGLSVVDPCFWTLFRTARATTLAGVPYTFELLDRVGFADMDLPHLRYVTQAGGRLAPDAVRRHARLGRARGWDLVVMYGQTEATARMAYLPPRLAEDAAGSIGIPVPGGAFDLEPVPGTDDLELVYTGPNVMLGYAEGPADLALGRSVHRLRTGDLARRRPDGLYEVVGRRSRFVKVAGLRVDLGRVEQVVAGMGLTGAAAGTDDDGVVVAVEVEGEGDLDARLLAGALAADLGLPRTAVVVRGVTELPRLPNGKPDHPRVLALGRDVAAAAASPGGARTAGGGSDGPVRVRPGAAEPAGAAAAVRRVLAEELGVADVPDDATFVGLEGDSLSYVATSVRLEQVVGDLPSDWHLRTVGELAALAERAARPAGRVPVTPLETGIALRGIGIVLVVATHIGLVHLQGSAHLLLAVAGYNFARLQLTGDRGPRLRRQLRSLARIVVPSVALIAVAHALTDRYGWANVLLLHAVVGSPTWTAQWHFWFVEVLVYLLAGAALLLAVPWADRAERRHPFAFPLALTGLGLLTRFEVVDPGVPHTAPALWLFALGWAVARAGTPARRLGLSVLAVVTVPGFFGDPLREALVLVGIGLLVWRTAVPVPTVLHRPLGVLASASLHVYLTHWLVYPVVEPVSPALALAASLATGVAYWALVGRVARAQRTAGRVRDRRAGGRRSPRRALSARPARP